MLFSIQILFKKIKKLFFQLLARSWFWRMLFSIQILIQKRLKIDFFTCWQNLGFGECFLLFKSQLKWLLKIEFFSAFGKILVLANVFVYSKTKTVLKNWCFQLLARSWFWRMFFSIQILDKKVLKNWFFQLLARSWFWRMFFLFKFQLKKYWKFDFFSFWQDLGFGECFFLSKFQLKKYWRLVFLLSGKPWFWRMLLSIGSLI